MDASKKTMNKSVMSMKKVLKGVVRAVVLFGCIVGLLVYVMNTNPANSNLAMTLVPLGFVWVIIFLFCLHFEYVFRKVGKRTISTVAAVSATVVTMLLMFSALGSVSLFDVLLLVLLALLGVFYFRRSWSK
jgi:hypothetical protein